jgi:hypothetical protein
MENIQDKGADLEEKQQEEELLKETPEDEVRQATIEKFGLNEEVDGELITKLVEDGLESRKKLSTAIKQKRSWRTKAQEAGIKPKSEEIPQPKGQEPISTNVESIIDKALDKRELDSLELSDELKKQVETYAKVQGVSVKKALSSDYVSFLREKEEKKERVENASLGTGRKGTAKKDYSDMKPEDFDLKTPEGKAEFAKYEDYLRKTLG